MRYYSILAAAFALAAGLIICAWPVIAPLVYLGLTVVISVAALSLSVALAILSIGFSFWRVRAARADALIAESAAMFAQEFSSPVIRPKPEILNLWLKAYLDLAWLGVTLGTLALDRMRPYFRENAQRLWTHMVDELKRAGYAKVVTRYSARGRPYKCTVWMGSYKNFFRRMMTGDLVLRPAPDMQPPIISTGNPYGETMKTTEMPETTEMTVVASRGGAVYKSKMQRAGRVIDGNKN